MFPDPILAREEYWARAWVRSSSDALAALGHYAALAPRELTWPGLALAAAGAVRLARRARWVLLAGLGMAGATVALVLSHGARNDIFVWNRYVLPALAVAVAFVGPGVDALVAAWKGSRRAWLLPVAALAPLALGVPAQDRSRFTLADGYNRRILERMPANAVLIADGDNQVFPLSYLHNALGVRPDVNLVLQGINVLSTLPIEPDSRPVFFTHYFDLHAPELELRAEGLVYRLVRRDAPASPELRWADWSVPELEDWAGQGTLDFLARSLVGDYHMMKALHYERRHPLASQEAARANLAVAADNPVNTANGALLLERLGLLREATGAFRRCLELDPRTEVCQRHLDSVEKQLALTGSPEGVQAVVAASVERFRGQDPTGAVDLLTEALGRWPAADRLHYNLGALALQAGQYGVALREMLVTLDLKPDDATARRDAGEIAKRLSR